MRTTKHLRVLTKAPDAKGSFVGVIQFNPEDGDKDGERIASFRNLPGEVPLGYHHTLAGDPASVIGKAYASTTDDRHLKVEGRLNLRRKMAQAVHERMLLPDSDDEALKELSVGISYDPREVTTDENGVKAIHDAELLEISVVRRGAQTTRISSVKETPDWQTDLQNLNARLDALSGTPQRAEVKELTVDQLVADAKAERTAAMNLTDPLPSEADREARDREAFSRFQAEVAQRDKERAEEAERLARMEELNRGGLIQINGRTVVR